MPLLLRSIVVGVTVGVTLFELCKLLASALQKQPSKVKCLEDQDDKDQDDANEPAAPPQEHYFCDATPAPRKTPLQSVQSPSQGSCKSFGLEIECAPQGGSVQFTLLANDISVDDGSLPSHGVSATATATTTRFPLEIQLDEDEQETHKDVLERIVADIDTIRSLQQQQQQQQGATANNNMNNNNNHTAVQIQLDADDASHQEFFQMLSEYVVLQQQELLDEANAHANAHAAATATATTTSIRSASSASISALSE